MLFSFRHVTQTSMYLPCPVHLFNTSPHQTITILYLLPRSPSSTASTPNSPAIPPNPPQRLSNIPTVLCVSSYAIEKVPTLRKLPLSSPSPPFLKIKPATPDIDPAFPSMIGRRKISPTNSSGSVNEIPSSSSPSCMFQSESGEVSELKMYFEVGISKRNSCTKARRPRRVMWPLFTLPNRFVDASSTFTSRISI